MEPATQEENIPKPISEEVIPFSISEEIISLNPTLNESFLAMSEEIILPIRQEVEEEEEEGIHPEPVSKFMQNQPIIYEFPMLSEAFLCKNPSPHKYKLDKFTNSHVQIKMVYKAALSRVYLKYRKKMKVQRQKHRRQTEKIVKLKNILEELQKKRLLNEPT